MSGFRIGGIGSGLDTQGMLEQLMRAERMPMDRMKQQRQVLQWKQEDYRAMNTKLLSFRTLAFDMSLSNKYTARSVISSNENVVGATASANATSGTYNVNVTQVATKSFANSVDKIGLVEGQSSSTKLNDLFGAGVLEDFEINGTKFSFDPANEGNTDFVYINKDENGDSLNNMITKINKSSAGVEVFYDSKEDKVFMSTKETGKEISFGDNPSVFLTNALGLDLDEERIVNGNHVYQKGQKALVTVNGYTLERENNNFSFAGVTFNIREEGISTITINKDNDKVLNNIKEFIEQYNSLLDATNKKLFEARDRGYPPLTDEQKEHLSDREAEKWEEIARAGHLRNDTVLQGALNSMRSVMGGAIEGLDVKMLAQIGITTGEYSERGKLHIDEAKLKKAIEENPDGVQKLFVGDGEVKGISSMLTKSIDSSMDKLRNQAGRSTNIVDQSSIGRSIKRIDDRIFAFEDRLQRIEDRHWRQFTAMEKVMNQMNNQSDWLNQQLMGMFQ